jgi:hypothetical protein
MPSACEGWDRIPLPHLPAAFAPAAAAATAPAAPPPAATVIVVAAAPAAAPPSLPAAAAVVGVEVHVLLGGAGLRGSAIHGACMAA